MLSEDENARLTHVGPGTPGGEWIRRYWQPAALSEELPLGGAPVPVRLLGEDLVLFRDETGQPGLLGIHCSHLGPDEPPLFPAYDFLTAPDECVTATKYFQDCNYLQGNEGNFDPQHLSFLHRLLSTTPDDFRNAIQSRDKAPTIDPVETEFGMHLYAVRKVDDDQNYVKVRGFIMPNGSLVDSRGDGC